MFIWTQFIDQLPVSLLALLVERCTGIAEVMGSNPVLTLHDKDALIKYLATRAPRPVKHPKGPLKKLK